MELTSSGDDTPTREWVLVGVANSSQLGSPERLKKMRQTKIEHGVYDHFLITSIGTSVNCMLQTK